MSREPNAPDVLLVGCVSQKGGHPARARDLYTSRLFLGRREYAESRHVRWFIISAEHGLLDPDEIVAPYNRCLLDLPPVNRGALGERVAEQLEKQLGDLSHKTFEVHAGQEYRDMLKPALRRRGAQLTCPVAHLRIGEQLAWYGGQHRAARHPERPPAARGTSIDRPTTPTTGLARALTERFADGSLDLSARAGAPSAGWESMPEVAVVEGLHASGCVKSDSEVRLFLTLLAAMDRARDAERLWRAGRNLRAAEPWAFDPAEVARRSFTQLTSVLQRFGVSQRHSRDAAAWRTIAESLLDAAAPEAIRRTIYEGVGTAAELLAALQAISLGGSPLFPFLRGPKIGPMWIRMLAVPGRAMIEGIEVLPVAVDVQVRKVTEYLGMTATQGMSLERARPLIQEAWSTDVERNRAAGPTGIDGTCAALDPALWFWGKWGCTFCERARERIPIAPECVARCRMQ